MLTLCGWHLDSFVEGFFGGIVDCFADGFFNGLVDVCVDGFDAYFVVGFDVCTP